MLTFLKLTFAHHRNAVDRKPARHRQLRYDTIRWCVFNVQ